MNKLVNVFYKYPPLLLPIMGILININDFAYDFIKPCCGNDKSQISSIYHYLSSFGKYSLFVFFCNYINFKIFTRDLKISLIKPFIWSLGVILLITFFHEDLNATKILIWFHVGIITGLCFYVIWLNVLAMKHNIYGYIPILFTITAFVIRFLPTHLISDDDFGLSILLPFVVCPIYCTYIIYKVKLKSFKIIF